MTSVLNALSITESILKCGALAAAGGFFLYKLWTGWLLVNMGVTIRAKRKRMNKQRDHLALIVGLDKGSNDSAYVRDIQVRVAPMFDGIPDFNQAIVCKAYGFAPIAETENGRANWLAAVRRDEIAISPGEKTEYAGYAEVDRKQVYFVEVVVFGDNRLYKWRMDRFVQWRASTVSLPEEE